MTREEAIKNLEHYRYCLDFQFGWFGEDDNEAIDMAIEALQAETTKAVPPKCDDLVKVVRCGSCKNLSSNGMCEEFADDCIRPSATDFCSHGERREPSNG